MKQATGSNSATPSKEMSIRLRSGGHSFPKELPAEYAAADRVVCSVLTHKTLLVPTEVFERESAPNYLALAGLGCAETECAVYSDPQRQQIAVMAVDKECRRQLAETAGDRVTFTSPLLFQLLYIKIYDNVLRLAEVVRAQGTADVLYYLGRLDRTFPLKTYPLCLSGSDTLARQLRKYFRDVRCE